MSCTCFLYTWDIYLLDTCVLNRKPLPLLIDFVYFIKAQAKKKTSPAGVALSMVPTLSKSSQIAQTWRMRNTKLQKYKAARHHVFNNFASNVFHSSNIESQRSDCQFRNSGSTWFACIKHVHITVHHITTWSLRLLIMFMSSQVRILKPSGVDPHRLCRPLSHIG